MEDDEKQGNDRKDGRHNGEILRPRGDYQTLSHDSPDSHGYSRGNFSGNLLDRLNAVDVDEADVNDRVSLWVA